MRWWNALRQQSLSKRAPSRRTVLALSLGIPAAIAVAGGTRATTLLPGGSLHTRAALESVSEDIVRDISLIASHAWAPPVHTASSAARVAVVDVLERDDLDPTSLEAYADLYTWVRDEAAIAFDQYPGAAAADYSIYVWPSPVSPRATESPEADGRLFTTFHFSTDASVKNSWIPLGTLTMTGLVDPTVDPPRVSDLVFDAPES